MKKNKNILIATTILIASFIVSPLALASTHDFTIQGVNNKALSLGLNAYYKLRNEGITHSNYLTLVDFTKPSTDDSRLIVINVPEKKIVLHGLVAHGKGSGNLYATHFSNNFNSDESSLGAYITGPTYIGHHGLSLHVIGEEKGINNNAYARTVELHPANYVSKDFIKKTGRIGRTLGCFGINPEFAKKLIPLIKNKSVLFAYSTQENHDPFVNQC